MASNSSIEWTHHTFNPWRGCAKVHEGCAHCYAESNMSVRLHGVKWGPNGTRVRLSDAGWKEPLKWNREAGSAGERRRVFCASLADVFEDWKGPIISYHGERLIRCDAADGCGIMPRDSDSETCPQCGDPHAMWLTIHDLRRDLFALIDQTPWLDWLLLTKRPENVRRMWPMMDDMRAIFPGAPGKLGEPMPCKVSGAKRKNVWLGTSVSNQETADRMVPTLLQCHHLCPVLFLSCEPLLGPINLQPHIDSTGSFNNSQGINCDWVIVGGESGHGARPMHPAWARSIRDQCQAAGVKLFFKQFGEWGPSLEGYSGPKLDPERLRYARGDGTIAEIGKGQLQSGGAELIYCIGKQAAGRLLDGREWNEFPEASRVPA